MGKTGALRVVVVGNDDCGKTSLLIAFLMDYLPGARSRLPVTLPTADITLGDGHVKTLQLCDTNGGEDYDRLRPLFYAKIDAIIICFSVNSRESFHAVKEKWIHEVAYFMPDLPKLLVATKTDLRQNEEEMTRLREAGEEMISTEEGERLAREIKAQYCECSALERQNVNEVFRTATLAALEGRAMKQKKKGFFRRFFSRQDRSS